MKLSLSSFFLFSMYPILHFVLSECSRTPRAINYAPVRSASASGKARLACIIGERERANLVVRLARFFCLCII